MSVSVGERVASNAALLIVSRILSRLVGLGVILLITRLLGAEGFGEFSFAFSFVGLFVAVVGMGLTPLVTREMSRERERAGTLLASVLVLRLAVLLPGLLALVWITRAVIGDPARWTPIYLAAASVFTVSFTGTLNGAFRAFEQTQYELLSFVSSKVILLVLCILCYLGGAGLTVVVGAFAVASVVEFLISGVLVRTRVVRSGYRVSAETVREVLTRSIPFALTAVVGVIYFRIDTVMLRFLKGDLMTGWYGGAYRFVEAVVFVPEMMAAALLPVLARRFVRGEPTAGVFARSFRLFFTLALPFALGATFLPRVTRLLGAGFEGSEEVLPLLGWTLFFLFLNFLMVTALNAAERQRWVTVALGAGAVANVALNLLLVPRWGHMGAGAATLISTALVFLAEVWAVSRTTGIRSIAPMIARPLAAGGATALVWFALGAYRLVWVVPLGGGVYVLALLLLGGMPAEDRALLRGALGGARAQVGAL